MGRPKSLPSTIKKQCPTCKKEFEISFYLRNKRIYCSKSCSNKSPDVIAKMISSQNKTFITKYGKHPMKTTKVVEILKNSIRKKYGVDWISQSKGWREKVKQNNLKKYGIENYNNIDKIRQTCIEKYGVPNYAMTTEYKEKYKNTCLKKYGVSHASSRQKIILENYNGIFDRFLKHPLFIQFEPMFSKSEFAGPSTKDYSFKCKRCGLIKKYSIDNGNYPVCPTCDKTPISKFQSEILEFIKSIMSEEIKFNDKSILPSKTLDVVIPSRNIAFKCNHILWNSELFGRKNKIYNVQITNAAILKHYRLIQIFESEWKTVPHIVKSIISSILEKSKYSVYGRDCHVKEITSHQCVIFLKQNHLQGPDRSSVKLGLFDPNDNLVSVMTFLKPRFNSNFQYEIGRLCNKIDIDVIGGTSKLFSYFLKNYRPTSIVSYNDRRYFDGQIYINLGFKFLGNTPPNYFYIVDNYQTIQNRLNWQKCKLKKKLHVFDPSLSEWENMKLNGYDRIWDCGNGKWVWTIH